MKSCQDLSQISNDFSVNQEESKSQCLLLIFFSLGITLYISGNKAETNTKKECVLGNLYLGVALLYKKFNLNSTNEKSNVSRPKKLVGEYWKK